jgi:hypothetical protein
MTAERIAPAAYLRSHDAARSPVSDANAVFSRRPPLARRIARARRALAIAGDEAFILPGRSERSRRIYPSLAELVRRYTDASAAPAATERDAALEAATGLTRFEYRVFSQNGEDGVLAELFRRLDIRDGSFVEFGVQSGREGNCVFLADVLGWRGLFMEMDSGDHATLERRYRANPRVTTRRAQVTPGNVESLFAGAGVLDEPAVVSIDVDGADYWVWRAIDSYRPLVVVIEYNAALDPERRLVQPADAPAGWSGTDCYGASLGALSALAEVKGYRLAHTELAGVNAFFVRADLDVALPPAEAVPVRAPNHFLAGHAHVADAGTLELVDLDTPAAGEVGT